jgi:hypothetical protein
MYKRVIWGMLAACLLALFTTQASARTCALTSSSGTCLFWSGSLAADLKSDKLSGGPNVPYAYNLVPDSESLPFNGQVTGVLLCKNQGGNLSPGIQTIFVTDKVFPNIYLTLSQPALNTTATTVDTGLFSVGFNKNPNQTTIDFLTQTFGAYCPNSNWVVTDAVPCTARMNVTLFKNGSPSETAAPLCSLNNPNTGFVCQALQQDPSNPEHFARQPYYCQ